jgi:Polyketide cyclase / dehydrase and lipid transport
MSRHWHQLVESDDDFLETAPFRYVNTVDVPVPPERTWAALTADETLVSWSPVVTGLRWTSPRPFSVGTTREVTLLRMVTARERYYRWDEGRRKTFTAVQASVPGLRRLAEDYVVEPTPTGSRFIWTLALEPGPTLKPFLRLTNPITSLTVRRIARGLRSQVG